MNSLKHLSKPHSRKKPNNNEETCSDWTLHQLAKERGVLPVARQLLCEVPRGRIREAAGHRLDKNLLRVKGGPLRAQDGLLKEYGI